MALSEAYRLAIPFSDCDAMEFTRKACSTANTLPRAVLIHRNIASEAVMI